MMSRRSALGDATSRLRAAGVDNAEREAAWLMAHVLSVSVGQLRARGDQVMDAGLLRRFSTLVDRRAAREPLQYILGAEEFLGMTFRVNPAVLIPRLDTEVLVQATVARVSGPVRIADIGTGSGAIAVGLAKLLPEASIVAVDISAAALAVAVDNAALNGVRVEFLQGDLLEPLAGQRFDAIVSNPPYIADGDMPGLMPEVRDWEPALALRAGPDGLAVYRWLAAGVGALLKPEGFAAVEVGAGQADQVAKLLAEAGLATETRLDTAGMCRVVIGHFR